MRRDVVVFACLETDPIMRKTTPIIALALLISSAFASAQTPWQPAKGPLSTRFAKDVSPDHTLPEYPRPQLTRPDWQNLNGLWDYAIYNTPAPTHCAPEKFDGKILVPFPIESSLSGVMKTVGDANRLFYHRTFEIPTTWSGKRTLLHFGAVEWQATVSINGANRSPPTHRRLRRNSPSDITFERPQTRPQNGSQELSVSVYDPTDAGTQPRGKQVNRPGGIWYTSVTGIWQTVWLEPVPEMHIDSLEIVPDIDAGTITVTVKVPGDHPNGRANDRRLPTLTRHQGPTAHAVRQHRLRE